MANTLRRRFTLLDAMILVASTAVGMWGLHELDLFSGSGFEMPPTWRQFFGFLVALYVELAPLSALWTVTLLALRFFRPRPRLRQLARQPGFVACLTVAACLVLEAVTTVVFLLSGVMPDSLIFLVLPTALGWAVGAAWLNLYLSGRWRVEPDWIDRVGRLAGIYWLTFPAALFVVFHFA